ncbi:hypothetical protein QQX98_003642 [Neonectria punicea]|uniref:Uncharacterized protein n=1 Tax=Neonectria punicea TaxID=979145 RepID=A0ABR1HDM1_9HYPO
MPKRTIRAMTNDDGMAVPDPTDRGDDRRKRPRIRERSASVPLKEVDADTNVPHDTAASDKIQVLQTSASDEVNTADDIAAPDFKPVGLSDIPHQVLRTEALDIINTAAAPDSDPISLSDSPHQVLKTEALDDANTADNTATLDSTPLGDGDIPHQVSQTKAASDHVNTEVPDSKPLGDGDITYQVLQTKALDIVNTHDTATALDSNPVGNSEDSHHILQTKASDNVITAAPDSKPLGHSDTPHQASQTKASDHVNTGDDTMALDPNPISARDSFHRVLETQASGYVNTGDDVAAPEPGDQASTSCPLLKMGYRQGKLLTHSGIEDYILIAKQQAEDFESHPQITVEDNILPYWKQLCSEIEVMVKIHFQGQSFSWADLSPETQEKVSRWTPKAKEYLEHVKMKDLILQACIWHTIDEKVFSPDWSTRWSSGPLAHFGKLKQDFQNTFNTPWKFDQHDPAYGCWVMFSHMLFRRKGTKMAYDCNTLARHIAHDLGEIIGADHDETTSLVHYIEEIAGFPDLVAELDLCFQKSCVKFWVAWQPKPTTADTNSNSLWGFPMQAGMKTADAGMETAEFDLKSRGQPVQIVSQPWLIADDQHSEFIRFNTASGEPYPSPPEPRILYHMRVEVDRVSGKE